MRQIMFEGKESMSVIRSIRTIGMLPEAILKERFINFKQFVLCNL